MVLPEPLRDMEIYLDRQGRLSLFEAGRLKKILNLYQREANKKSDESLRFEVERLRGRVESATKLPPARITAPTRAIDKVVLLHDAEIVWQQLSLPERNLLLAKMGVSGPLRELNVDQLEKIVEYPRSGERKEYLRSTRGMRRPTWVNYYVRRHRRR